MKKIIELRGPEGVSSNRGVQPLNGRVVNYGPPAEYKEYSYPESEANGWKGVCVTGLEQSPIDLAGATAARPSPLKLDYKEATFKSKGKLSLNFAHSSGDTSTFVPPGQDKVFNLLGVHIHLWSEHTANGDYFPIEAHFVHQAADNSLAVIGLFFETESDVKSDTWEILIDALDGLSATETEVKATFNPLDMFGDSPLNRFWNYDGSLTTPPCSEGVLWHVVETPTSISKAQYNQILSLRHTDLSSNRGVQRLYGRQIRGAKAYTYPETQENGWTDVCATGKVQSPINLEGVTVARGNALALNYSKGKFESHGGLSLKFKAKDAKASYFVPPGQGSKKFYFLGVHIHTRSEHTLNGVSYPMEAHFVHASDDGSLAVVGIFYEIGAGSPIWEDMISAFDSSEVAHLEMNPMTMFGGSRLDRFWNFDGSLTTPPCSEGVLWHVLEEPVSVSAKQYEEILRLRGEDIDSNRGVMPTNDRKITAGPLTGDEPDTSSDDSAPTWAIVVIVILSLILLGFIAYTRCGGGDNEKTSGGQHKAIPSKDPSQVAMTVVGAQGTSI